MRGNHSVRRLLGRGLLLAVPFLLVALLVFVVDPFEYFGTSRVISHDAKARTSGKLHYALWKFSQYERNPASRILLGDSRMDLVDTTMLRQVTGQRYFNFAYGGGTLLEAIDTYWLASRMVRLDAVYLEMGLINFNEYQSLNRVPEARQLAANPILYLTSRMVVRASVLAAYADLSGRPVHIETPALDRVRFWRFQVDESIPQLLHRYAYPTATARRLQEMAADCRQNGTRLVIIVPPSHVDVQRKTTALGRAADLERFKAFARTLGDVYDFDYPNVLTMDADQFSDPFHLRSDSLLIQDVWGSSPRFARRSP